MFAFLWPDVFANYCSSNLVVLFTALFFILKKKQQQQKKALQKIWPKRTPCCTSSFKSNLTFPLEEKHVLLHVIDAITIDESKRNEFVTKATKN